MSETEMLAIVVMLGAGVAAIYFVADALRAHHRTKLSAGIYDRLIEKFGSAADLNQFLERGGGSHFLEALSSGKEGPRQKILASLQRGVLLLFSGAALLAMTPEFGLRSPALVFGAILFSLGLGYLVAAGISWRLSKSWGLIANKTDGVD